MENNIQKFSLRKYKGIGATSVLLGMLYLGTTPVLAQNTTTSPKEALERSNDIVILCLKRMCFTYQMVADV